jgi:hypothetical protein
MSASIKDRGPWLVSESATDEPGKNVILIEFTRTEALC